MTRGGAQQTTTHDSAKRIEHRRGDQRDDPTFCVVESAPLAKTSRERTVRIEECTAAPEGQPISGSQAQVFTLHTKPAPQPPQFDEQTHERVLGLQT
jgi:hypothetical protein